MKTFATSAQYARMEDNTTAVIRVHALFESLQIVVKVVNLNLSFFPTKLFEYT